MRQDSLRNASFSTFHDNICSLRRDLETHILDKLDFPFGIIEITETRITNEDLGGFNYNIPGYSFEYVPTPLSAGGVGVTKGNPVFVLTDSNIDLLRIN